MQTISSRSIKDTVKALPGCRVAFRLTAKETNEALSVMDVQMLPGSEPARHFHLWEDETIIVHKGSITFFIGDEIINAQKDDVVFIPRTVPHHFVITSPTVRCTLLVTPGGFERFFEEAANALGENGVAPAAQPGRGYSALLQRSAEKYGVRFV